MKTKKIAGNEAVLSLESAVFYRKKRVECNSYYIH